MNFSFTGKKILVTGAGRGIGRGIAIALAKAGCKVYALSRTQSTLDSLAAEFPDISTITVDLSDWDQTRKALDQIETLDGLVNNAASGDHDAPALEVTKESIDAAINTNLLSAINCIQVVAGKMVNAKVSGSIVNVSSVSSMSALPSGLAYNVSKAGMDMVTKQFALELGPHDIRVNSVNPTVVMTDEMKKVVDSGLPVLDIFKERTPMPRFPEVEDIVNPVLYLLSNTSAMVTGTMHIIDGGIMCNITTQA